MNFRTGTVAKFVALTVNSCCSFYLVVFEPMLFQQLTLGVSSVQLHEKLVY